MPFPLPVLAMAMQTVLSQSEGQVRLAVRRHYTGYSLCDSFSDPFPGHASAYRLARIVPQSVLARGGKHALRRGTVVLVADRRGGLAGVFDPHRGNEGCVLASTIAALPTPATAFADWSGAWERIPVRGNARVRLIVHRFAGTSLTVSGEGFGLSIGEPHDGTLRLDNMGDPDCPMRLTLLGGYLIASDRVAADCRAEVRGMAGVYRHNPGIAVEPTVEVRDLHARSGFGFAADAPDLAVPLSMPPVPRLALSEVAGIDDYPPQALRLRVQGISRLDITVGPEGRATACRASGGGAELDAAACRKVRAHARFTPALDLHGAAVSAVIQWTIAWRIPPAWRGDEYPQPLLP